MLKIGRFLVSNSVNGPGKRLVIWFQGCPIRCKGCFNPEFWDVEGGVSKSVQEIIEEIKSIKGIEGVTFTGGEPLAQAEHLLPLCEFIKSLGLSIVCYTGYILEDIASGKIPYAREILRYIDILIDGPYIEEEKAPLLWRGSKNQRVLFLSKRYIHLKPLLKDGTRTAEIQIGNQEVFLTGIYEKEIWESLKKEIKK